MSIFIGLDVSTQGLTATAIEIDGAVGHIVFEHSFDYHDALPAYGTDRGVLPSPDARVAEAPPRMWAEALDRMMGEVSVRVDPRRVCAISGSAQQHGTVYLTKAALEQLAYLEPTRPLAEQTTAWFTRDRSPIWMDSSTSDACDEITAAVGGASRLAQLTGSRAFERFAGPQIRKFARDRPADYARTARIHLISSFLASLLAGTEAPVDPGDGSGTNLMDVVGRRWAPAALRATAPGLAARLPPLQESWSIVGTLAPYWRRRYGYPAADVVAWSGDNPCSLIGAGIVREGQVGISLGTSDTIFGFMKDARIDPSGTGHVFGSPTGHYMGLTCFRNGSLARERVRDQYGLDWSAFSAALRATPPGNNGGIMLPWFEPEITPLVGTPGVRRFALDSHDAAANVRAVVEAQAMAMRLHSQWMNVSIETVHAVGGASANRDILQVIADVLGATVYPPATGNAAALGAALRAWHAHERVREREISWSDVTLRFNPLGHGDALRSRTELQPIYQRLLDRYREHEASARR